MRMKSKVKRQQRERIGVQKKRKQREAAGEKEGREQ